MAEVAVKEGSPEIKGSLRTYTFCICSGNAGTPAVGRERSECSRSTNTNETSGSQRIKLATCGKCVGAGM